MGWIGRSLLLAAVGVVFIGLLVSQFGGPSVILVRQITALVTAAFQAPLCSGLFARGLVLVLAGSVTILWAFVAGSYNSTGLGGPAYGRGAVLLFALGGTAMLGGVGAMALGIVRRLRA